MIKHEFRGDVTVAYVDGCEFLAVERIVRRAPYIREWVNRVGGISKIIGMNANEDVFRLNEAVLRDRYQVQITLKDGDTYDKEFAIRETNKLLMNKVDKAVEKAMRLWACKHNKFIVNNILNEQAKATLAIGCAALTTKQHKAFCEKHRDAEACKCVVLTPEEHKALHEKHRD